MLNNIIATRLLIELSRLGEASKMIFLPRETKWLLKKITSNENISGIKTECYKIVKGKNMLKRYRLLKDSYSKGFEFFKSATVAIRCVHVDTVLYPLAELQLEVEGHSIKVETAVSGNLHQCNTDVLELTMLLTGTTKAENSQTGKYWQCNQSRGKGNLKSCKLIKRTLHGVQPSPLSDVNETTSRESDQ